VQSVTENNATRDRLTTGLYMEQGDNNPLAHVNEVFLESLELEPLNKKIKQAIKDKIAKAREAEVISKEEADQLIAFDEQLMSVIHVDDFEQDELVRTACPESA